MTTKSIAVIAILLWAVSVAFIGYRFVSGSTVIAEDGREAIVLEASERSFVLGEMRAMLASVQDIIGAINAKDMAQVKEIAHKVGMAEAQAAPMSVMLKLPLAFKQLGLATHEGFDEIGAAADVSAEAVLQKLDENLSKCVACHETYQFTVAN
jgi:hypothetical protein